MSIKAIDIINKAKQKFAKREITVVSNEGEEIKILIQEKLDEVNLSRIIADLVMRSQEFSKIGLDFDIIMNIYALLIKYFTDIKFNKSKDIAKQVNHEIDTIEALINLGVYEQILNHFNEDCIKDLEKLFDKYPKQMGSVINDIVEKEVLADADI